MPRNITALEDLTFTDLIEVRRRKKYYEVPVFYCKQLHMWFRGRTMRRKQLYKFWLWKMRRSE